MHSSEADSLMVWGLVSVFHHHRCMFFMTNVLPETTVVKHHQSVSQSLLSLSHTLPAFYIAADPLVLNSISIRILLE